MRSPVLFIFFFSTVAVLGIAHNVAVEFFFYWKYWWFDLITHTLGGISVAFAVQLAPAFVEKIRKERLTFASVVTSVFVIGIVWEIFEVLAQISIIEPGYVVDTLSDLCMDIIGGVIGYGVGNQMRRL